MNNIKTLAYLREMGCIPRAPSEGGIYKDPKVGELVERLLKAYNEMEEIDKQIFELAKAEGWTPL